MQVKLLKQIAGSMGVHEAGTVVDLVPQTAEALIGAGVAVAVASGGVIVVEAAALVQPETATMPTAAPAPGAIPEGVNKSAAGAGSGQAHDGDGKPGGSKRRPKGKAKA